MPPAVPTTDELPGIVSDPITRNEGAWNEGLDGYEPSLSTYLGARFWSAAGALTGRVMRFTERQYAEGAGRQPEPRAIPVPQSSPMLEAKDANDRYGIPGVLKFDGPTPESVAQSLNEHHRSELATDDIRRRRDAGVGGGLLGTAAEFAGSFLDPLNVAAGFVPGVGEARMAAWLAKAGGSTLARAGVRAGVGAIRGVVGGAPLVALDYGLSRQDQDDVSAADELLNLGMIAGIGAVTHVGGGMLADRFSRQAELGKALDQAPIETREAGLRAAVGQLAAKGRVDGMDDLLQGQVDQIAQVHGPAAAAPLRAVGGARAFHVDEGGLQPFQPDELGVDAKTMQFKAGADAEGVTDRLQGIAEWDPVKAGTIIVYQDMNGRHWIADGHQRLALARRLAAEYPERPAPQLYGWVFRAKDGVTPPEVRAIAAAKNIAEGTGTAVDAAKVLRDLPELAKTLPPRSELVRSARALANLDDHAFGMVVNGLVPPSQAAIVGRLAPEGAMEQRALLDLLAKTQPDNLTEAEAIVRQGLAAGHVEHRQMGLFGEEAVATNLFLDRARVLDRTVKELRTDRKLFQAIARERTKIEAAGNKLKQRTNIEKAQVDAQALQLIQTLANRAGELSDRLTAGARSVREGKSSYAAAAREFAAAVRDAARRGDFDRLAAGRDGGVADAGNEGGASARAAGAELDHAAAGAEAAAGGSEAGTPAARSSSGLAQGRSSKAAIEASVERQAPSRQTSTPRPPEGVFAARSKSPLSESGAPSRTEAIEQSPGVYHHTQDMAMIERVARETEGDLRTLLDWSAEGIEGARVYGTRIKTGADIADKLAYGKRPDQIGDVLGGRIVVEDDAALADVIDRLERGAEVIDRDDKLATPNASGYRAYHIQVMGRDGVSAEVQIVPREIAEVQGEAHALYREWRRRNPETPGEVEAKEQSETRQRQLFDDAWKVWEARHAGEGDATATGSEGATPRAAPGEGEPAVRAPPEDLFAAPERSMPRYPTDEEVGAATMRAAGASKGEEGARLDAALAAAEDDLAELKEAGLATDAEPELQEAQEATRQAGILERAYRAGAACLAREA